ncbi:MAG TPA: FtsX-like permease family protein [Longimicrobiales bacterium]
MQVAVVVMLTTLVVTLGSALRSYRGVEVGYDADRVAVVVPDYEAAEYGPQRMLELGAQLAAALERYPIVEGTALWRETVQEYPPRPEADVVYEGAPDGLTMRERLYRYHEVSPSYFRTLGIAVVRGRGFTEGDDAGAPPVVVVNESAARVWWPGQDPIGRRLKLGRDAPWLTVVGLVEDVQGTHHLARMVAAGLAARAQPPRPVLFRPLAQGGDPPPGWRNSGGCLGCEGVVIAARAAREPARVTALMRAEIRRLDPRLPVLEAGTLLERQLGDPLARELRFNRRLASAGSVVALLLALLGIYGVVADAVRRRTREIGIRIALGARPRQVLAGVAREGLLAAAGGALLGVLAVVALRGPVHRFLLHGDYAALGTGVTDAGALAVATAALLALALLASWAGARRATRVDPVEALRCE